MQTLPKHSPNKTPAPVAVTGDQQFLLFRLGGHNVCVPVAHVRHIAALPPDFSCCGAAAARYFAFEDEPLPYVSLWDRFALKSEYAEYEEMQEMFPKRLQDHIDWMAALEQSITNGTPFSKARNPRECAFGKWFYGYQTKDQMLSLLLGQFEEPHATIHALADRLLGQVEQGDAQAALAAFHDAEHTTLATVRRLFDQAQELIVKLQRRIGVVVSDGEYTCVLGADYVRDILTIPAERIKPQGSRKAANEEATISALILLEDQSTVPLLNWKKFCTEGVG